MFGGRDLREVLGLGGVFFVAARAQNLHVRQSGLDADEIGHVLSLGTVARLARDMGMLTGGARLRFRVVTLNACGLPGECHGALPDEVEGSRTVVAVFTEILGDHGTPDQQKES